LDCTRIRAKHDAGGGKEVIYESTRKMTIKEQQAYDLGYANGKAEHSLVPDPITGLVPCGCGGKAEIAGCSGDADYYSIICVECNIDTDSYEKKEDAKAAWNTAMGYKGDV
jgi:hypothetical protein